MADPWLARDFYLYHSDDGTDYQVGLSLGNADAGDFTVVVEGANPSFQVGWEMRHVLGKAGDGSKTKIPIASNTDTKYTTGGTVTKATVEYVIQGRIGERMTSKK